MLHSISHGAWEVCSCAVMSGRQKADTRGGGGGQSGNEARFINKVQVSSCVQYSYFWHSMYGKRAVKIARKNCLWLSKIVVACVHVNVLLHIYMLRGCGSALFNTLLHGLRTLGEYCQLTSFICCEHSRNPSTNPCMRLGDIFSLEFLWLTGTVE